LIWLGNSRGFLSDWVTQQWVRTTGHRVSLAEHAWLDGPAGGTRLIGKEFFTDYAAKNNLQLLDAGCRGLIEDFSQLSAASNDLSNVAAPVKDFYERTSNYELDAWSEWHGLFQPFGLALAVIFSRRLQQLNIPLSSLDSSAGMTSRVLQMRDRDSGQLVQTAWVRELHATQNVLYAGSYSICTVPGYPSPCVKVVFPLPNGNAIVLMKPEAHSDGSFSVISAGKKFGDPGFYFTLHDKNGLVWARYVNSLKETIHVYAAQSGIVRADHVLWIWGCEFLRLHYRMRLTTPPTHPPASPSGSP
jgi:hypothetical protein